MFRFKDGADIKDQYYFEMNCMRCVWSGGFVGKDGCFVRCCDYDGENTPFDTLDACPAGGPVLEETYLEERESRGQ